MGRSPYAFEGLLAGGAFAVADALGCGLPRDTLLPWWIAASGLVLGAIGASFGAASRRPGVATGVVVLLAHGAQWAAIFSKDWSAALTQSNLSGVFLLVAVAAVATAFAAGMLVEVSLRITAILFAVALIPASSYLATFAPPVAWPGLAFAFGPAVLLLLAALVARLSRRRGAVLLPALAILGFAGSALPLRPEFDGEPSPAVRAQTARAEPQAPDVLIVVIDALRADHVGRGSAAPGTPALDALADSGIEFTQAVSSASWTLPSHGTLFTGVAPSQHGAVARTSRLRFELPTLASILREAGWRTAAFTGGGFLVPATGLDAGFERFDSAAELHDHALARHVPLVMRIARNRFLPIGPIVDSVPRSGGLDRIATKVGEWLESRDRAQPFLVFAHTYQVHDYFAWQADWDAPERFAGRFAERLWVDPREIAESAGEAESAAFARIYARRVAHVDAAIGRLVESARAAAGSRPLVTIVTSDHGEGFDVSTRRFGHGGRLHDDLLRVPLIVAAEGRLPGGRRIDAQVGLIDVLPTLLELLDLPVPGGLEGRSLLPLVTSAPESSGAQGANGAPQAAPVPAWSEDGIGAERRVGLRASGWKLIRRGEELEGYDLASDPFERRSRADQAPHGLVQRLDAWIAAHEIGAVADAPFDAMMREHLRQLGY